VWDFIAYAERQKISVGPGRGSGVGSIVAYALGITKLDPLRYELLFERFLNPERVSSPDFDIDFCVDRRDEVIQYVVGKYGADNVCQIITFGSLAAKAAVKDVARVFSLPFSESDKITKLMPSMMGKLKLRDLVDDKKIDNEGNQTAIPDLLNLYRNDETVQKIIDMAMQIEGLPRQSGVHAAGVIICKNPVSNHVPLAKSKEDIKTKESYTTTQFNMNECEELGLLKMDFLGLRTLTDIQKALDIIENNHGKKIDFYTMEYDDPLVYEMIGTGDTHAVFQLESSGMKMFMRDLKPTVFEDIIAGVALYRPGPMQYIKQFALGKRDPRTVKFDHSLLEPIFKVTYGIMAYQEQVMQAVQVLAGYTLGRADELRRMISKKKSSLFAAERKIFLFGSKKANIPGAIANGISEKIANKVYDDIVKFADYAFNKSHAAAYAALAYQTAYLKTHYLVEFITAVLNNRINSIDEITNYLGYLKSKGKKVLLPDINKSLAEFSVEDGAVRVGLAAIKNVGEAVVSEILAERSKNGNFKDFEEFVTRMINRTVNKRMLESLILAGAFDCFGNTRHQLMQVYDGVIQRATKDKERGASGQFSLFDAPEFKAQKVPFPHYDEYDILLKLQFEKESAGVYLSGHPLDGYAEFLNSFPLDSSHFQKEVMTEDGGAVLLESEENSSAITDGMAVSLGGILSEADIRFTKKGNKEIGIGKIEDLAGTVDIMLSSMVLTKYKSLFQRDKLVKIKGSVKIGELGTTVWVNEMVEVSKDAASGKIRKVCFKMDMTDKAVMGELDEILLAYKGADEAYIRSTHDGKLYKLDYGVNLCDTLQIEVNACIGENNIVVSEKK
ncbi:MAG: DNA polymerase III subunit alpha, partial [Firmicutes bacterium]|nr:DNA polymerase III subunit alpha [Bacillota bacterium]